MFALVDSALPQSVSWMFLAFQSPSFIQIPSFLCATYFMLRYWPLCVMVFDFLLPCGDDNVQIQLVLWLVHVELVAHVRDCLILVGPMVEHYHIHLMQWFLHFWCHPLLAPDHLCCCVAYFISFVPCMWCLIFFPGGSEIPPPNSSMVLPIQRPTFIQTQSLLLWHLHFPPMDQF